MFNTVLKNGPLCVMRFCLTVLADDFKLTMWFYKRQQSEH